MTRFFLRQHAIHRSTVWNSALGAAYLFDSRAAGWHPRLQGFHTSHQQHPRRLSSDLGGVRIGGPNYFVLRAEWYPRSVSQQLRVQQEAPRSVSQQLRTTGIVQEAR